MKKLVVKLPFKINLRSKNVNTSSESKDSYSSKVAKESERKRISKYRLKVKSNPEKSADLRAKKKVENQLYNKKVIEMRKNDADYDEQVRIKDRKRKQKYRMQKKQDIHNQNKTDKAAPPTDKKKTITPQKVRNANRVRKQAERTKKSLPADSKGWANTVNHLIKNATPRRKSMIKLTSGNEKELNNILNITKKGRPAKSSVSVKSKIAHSAVSEEFWSNKKGLNQYKRRKKVQVKRMTKATLFKKSWKCQIESFLNDHSRVMPNKKDTILVDGEPIAKRHILITKRELYKKFVNLHPTFNRKYIAFLKLIPKNYKNLNMTCRRVCVCTKDYNIEKKIETMNNLATRNEMLNLKTSIRTLSNLTVCPFEDRPKRLCVDRKCGACGTDKVKEFYKPLIEKCNQEEKVKYLQWEQIDEKYTLKDGTTRRTKRWVQSVKTITANDLVDLIANEMNAFTGHLFRSDFQHTIENKLMSAELPLDHCVVVMDFSENISLQPQDEIESAHWTTKQVTLHPIFIVRHAPDSCKEEPKLIKESLIIVSDSLAHNAESVYVYTSKLIAHLQNSPGPCDIKTIHRFSDNCGVQYKCKDAFSHLLQLEDTYGLKIFYHFTESGHGKGQSDGLGAAIKMRLQRLILGEKKVINNAYQVYLALTQTKNLSANQKILYVPQSSIKLGKPQQLHAKTIKGTMSFHMVHSHGQGGVLKCSDLSCSCMVCIAGHEGPCYYSQYRNKAVLHDVISGKHILDNNKNQAVVATIDDVFEQSLLDQEEQVAQIESSLVEFACNVSKQGWKIRGETPADGNCCFCAVSDQLQRLGKNHISHTDLRHDVVNFIRNLPEANKADIVGFLTIPLETYLHSMSLDSTYADHITLQAISTMLGVHISIIHPDTKDNVVLHPVQSTSPTKVIYIGYLPEMQHFISLDRIQSEDFVAVILSDRRRKQTYIAKVLQVDVDDVELSFMKQTLRKGVFFWPEKEENFWQSMSDIVLTLNTPQLVPGRGIKLKFSAEDMLLIAKLK